MKRQARKEKLGMAFLCLLSFVILVPIYFAVINSVKSQQEAGLMNVAWPTEWHFLENYSMVLKSGNILHNFGNSCFITIICVTTVLLTSSMMAFVIVRRKSTLSSVLNTLVVLGMVFPLQIIPTYFVCKYLHLGNTASAIFVLIASNLSFSTFLYIGYIKSIPREIDESAWVDGAGQLTLFFKLIFPLLKPVTVTSLIITFMSVWNDFGISIYFLNNSKNMTLPLTIYNFYGSYNSQWQLVFANVIIVSLPVTLLYLFLQKHIMSGMTAGAVKG